MKNITVIIAMAILLALIIGCGGSKLKLQPTAEKQFELAKKDYDKNKYYKSIEGFQRVIFNFPGAALVDTAQYFLAMSYFGNKEYELSAVEFRRLRSSYPQTQFRDEAQYMEALSYLNNTPKNYALDQEELKQAINLLEEFIIDNPDSPIISDARNSINDGWTKLARKDFENGILYYKMYDYRAAEIYFQSVIDGFTSTSYAADALYYLSLISYKLKKYDEALIRLTNFKMVYPESELMPKVDEYMVKINEDIQAAAVNNTNTEVELEEDKTEESTSEEDGNS